MRAKLVAALAAAHPVDVASPVELRSTLAQSEDWGIAGLEAEGAGSGVGFELLNHAGPFRFHANGQRIRRELYREIAAFYGAGTSEGPQSRRGLTPVLFHQRAVRRD